MSATLLSLLAVAVTFAAGADPALLSAVERLGVAYRDADQATLEKLITEDYVHTNGASDPIDREAWLAWVASRAEAIAAGELEVLSYQTSDLSIVRHDSTAIVTGINRMTRRRDGQLENSAIRFTMVWIETDEGWRRAAFQDCRIED